jgi:hypothetical protein
LVAKWRPWVQDPGTEGNKLTKKAGTPAVLRGRELGNGRCLAGLFGESDRAVSGSRENETVDIHYIYLHTVH